MGVKYGTFPRVLVAISTVLSLSAATVALFSHGLGFLVSIIILGIGGGFNSIVHFLFAPGITFSGDPEPVWDNPEAEAVAAANSMLFGEKSTGETTGRILGAAGAAVNQKSRLLTPVDLSRTTQPKTDPEAERRKKEAEWAEMFRAL